MAYDPNLRITVGPRCTVGELKEMVRDIPDEYEIACCGQEEFYLHVDPENEVVTADVEEEIESDLDDEI